VKDQLTQGAVLEGLEKGDGTIPATRAVIVVFPPDKFSTILKHHCKQPNERLPILGSKCLEKLAAEPSSSTGFALVLEERNGSFQLLVKFLHIIVIIIVASASMAMVVVVMIVMMRECRESSRALIVKLYPRNQKDRIYTMNLSEGTQEWHAIR